MVSNRNHHNLIIQQTMREELAMQFLFQWKATLDGASVWLQVDTSFHFEAAISEYGYFS